MPKNSLVQENSHPAFIESSGSASIISPSPRVHNMHKALDQDFDVLSIAYNKKDRKKQRYLRKQKDRIY